MMAASWLSRHWHRADGLLISYKVVGRSLTNVDPHITGLRLQVESVITVL